VRTFLGKNNYAGKITLTVINPPRCGLSKKVKKRLVELGAPYLFYSSCNPVSFFEDVKDLSSCYRVEFIEPFDFFPHTPHVEIFAFLKRNT
jgi:tRNA/tmRNA/rRNA uracil-C5-methylase (TrmA/RlmC/RlmD family)